MILKLVNFVGFQVVWFAAVLGAAAGSPWLGPLAALMWLAIHFSMVSDGRRDEAGLVVCAAALGYLFDSTLFTAGLLTVVPHGVLGGPSPMWVVALWAAFATTLRHSMGWLRGRLVLAAMAGAVFGPLAYAGAATLGSITIDGMAGLVGVGLEYAIAMPCLLALSAWLGRVRTRAPLAEPGA